jgi:hypothetical protein
MNDKGKGSGFRTYDADYWAFIWAQIERGSVLVCDGDRQSFEFINDEQAISK